jgi:stearoyl-CoA desaturase (delta-9 desaturase)
MARAARRLDLGALLWLLLMHGGAALALLLPWRWSLWPMMLVVYLIGGLGTTVGYHRLLAHRAFRCSRWLEHLLVTMAMINTPGSPLLWVANHRQHHGHSDRPGDPHSPHEGLWRSHMGWLLDPESTIPELWRRSCRDLADDAYYRWLLRYRMVPQALGILAVGLTFGWASAPQVFFLPTVAWMNSTFAVNSIAHTFGAQPYRSGDNSRDNVIVGVLALGEGWHNTHHSFPRSARHGLEWWQLDVSWWAIWALARVGLVWDVQLPNAAQREARRRSPAR